MMQAHCIYEDQTVSDESRKTGVRKDIIDHLVPSITVQTQRRMEITSLLLRHDRHSLISFYSGAKNVTPF